MFEEVDREYSWEGTPLQMGMDLDPYGIEEIAIKFDTGDEEILKPRMSDEFGSYELWEAASYIGFLSRELG